MTPSRRGLLKGLAASPLARIFTRSRESSAHFGVYSSGTFRVFEGIEDDILSGPKTGDTGSANARRLARKAMNAFTKEHRRSERRKEIVSALTGGWPPHVAVMESNALWFRAMVAARWIEKREHDANDWFSAARRRFLGDDDDY